MLNVWMESSDGRIIRADIELLSRSNVVQTMLNLVSIDYIENITILLDISSFALTRILLWAEYHKYDQEPAWVYNNKIVNEDKIEDWDKEFLREPKCNIEAIMQGADYLNIMWLKKLCAYKLQLLVEQYMRKHGTEQPETEDDGY